jgi:hypothetical protein
MVLPGVNSVIVPVPSVVVVVVVVCDTCAHANGAANANAMLNITFFIFPFLFPNLPTPNRSNLPTNPLPFYGVKCNRRLPDRRLGLKDAGFNSIRRARASGYSTQWGNVTYETIVMRLRFPNGQLRCRSVSLRMRVDTADRTREVRFRRCCRFRQFHCQSCAQAKR